MAHVHYLARANEAWAAIFALLTALVNAVALTTQHLASTRARLDLRGFPLWRYLLRQPLWYAGWLALFGSLVFQSLALHFGPLSQVQPLLVSELVMGLVIRQWWLRQRVAGAAWSSAAVTVAGLALFLTAASPRPGLASASSSRVQTTLVVVGIAIGFTWWLVRRASPDRRAASFATITGVLWALEATFIKSTTDSLTHDGVVGAFAHWPIYAFALGGVAGLISEQAALHAGPLRVSQPLIVLVDPLASVLLGVWLFHERLRSTSLAVVLAVTGLCAMGVGVVAMTRFVSPTLLPTRDELSLPRIASDE
ncbi:MAG: DMT family transporter [Acidobacteriota bacterium]|nr:DMT family transporter [Acidobacteriota bacterium]